MKQHYIKSFLLLNALFLLLTISVKAQHVGTVVEFMPAPGQFINVMPSYTVGDDSIAMIAKAQNIFTQGSLLSLGGCGGYITFYYPQGIGNMAGEYDFRVLGNAFANNAEPGVIMVMKDENGNGLPDDTWYEIWGSEHDHAETNTDYSTTYNNPTHAQEAESLPTDSLFWYASVGSNAYLPTNTYRAQSDWPCFDVRASITSATTSSPCNT